MPFDQLADKNYLNKSEGWSLISNAIHPKSYSLELANFFRLELPNIASPIVLDAGSGFSQVSRELAKKGFICHCVDSDSDMQNLAHSVTSTHLTKKIIFYKQNWHNHLKETSTQYDIIMNIGNGLSTDGIWESSSKIETKWLNPQLMETRIMNFLQEAYLKTNPGGLILIDTIPEHEEEIMNKTKGKFEINEGDININGTIFYYPPKIRVVNEIGTLKIRKKDEETNNILEMTKNYRGSTQYYSLLPSQLKSMWHKINPALDVKELQLEHEKNYTITYIKKP
ncbi:MAG: class I SAM-dependent methyltransferase [Candidatus Woesearchaeota archaeon]|jgi:hypothetical protein